MGVLGPRSEQVERPDGIWIFQPVVTPGTPGLETASWVELAVGSPAPKLDFVLLGLIGLVPDCLSILRWLLVAFHLLVVVLVYAERRSERFLVAQEQLRRREFQRAEVAAAAALPRWKTASIRQANKLRSRVFFQGLQSFKPWAPSPTQSSLGIPLLRQPLEGGRIRGNRVNRGESQAEHGEPIRPLTG